MVRTRLNTYKPRPTIWLNPAAGSAPSETFTRRTCVGRRFWLRTGTLRPPAEFQKMLDHAGIVFTDPVRAVARLQLGRALASAGDRMKARAAYQDFLTLWKEADSHIPLLKRTKAEYALLL